MCTYLSIHILECHWVLQPFSVVGCQRRVPYSDVDWIQDVHLFQSSIVSAIDLLYQDVRQLDWRKKKLNTNKFSILKVIFVIYNPIQLCYQLILLQNTSIALYCLLHTWKKTPKITYWLLWYSCLEPV